LDYTHRVGGISSISTPDVMPEASADPVAAYGTHFHASRGTTPIETGGGDSGEESSPYMWKAWGNVLVQLSHSSMSVAHQALYDSGADRNVISLERVKLWRLVPFKKKNNTQRFTMSDGRKINANWYCYSTWVPQEWRMGDKLKDPWESRFYIVDNPPWELIIGRLEVFEKGIFTNNLPESKTRRKFCLGPVRLTELIAFSTKPKGGKPLPKFYLVQVLTKV
jgi:hypothetical protein